MRIAQKAIEDIDEHPDFSTAENNQELAQEVSCLKAMITLMLQAMGQADAGRVIIKMENKSRRWKMRLRLPYSPAPLSKLSRHIVVINYRLKVLLTAGLTSGTQNNTEIKLARRYGIAGNLVLFGALNFRCIFSDGN